MTLGDAVLRVYTFFTTLSIENIKKQFVFDKEEDSDFLKNILKDKRIIGGFIAILGIIFFLLPFEIFLIIVIILSMFFFILFYLPKFKEKQKYEDITLELPYALRHMATELKSGKGLHDVLYTISVSDYGSLSLEFKRVLEEVKYGENTEVALISMGERVGSEGLTRAIRQIIGTLRVGGNLASNLSIIAEDISFDMQIKLKEYTQKLNGFILIYTFLAILLPVILLIMLMAASTVMGDIIPSNIVLILYILLFPMVVIIMGVLIKSLEPKI